jgi:hypothetical protein
VPANLLPRPAVPLVIAATLLLGCGSDPAGTSPAPAAVSAAAVAAAPTLVVHKTPTCACCGEYEAYLEALGFTIETEVHDDLAPIKAALGIPASESSCHTNEVAGYGVEGHVPAEAILQLLDERPDIDAITLAGMPLGSPGMPGEQQEPFVVRTVAAGEVVGELGRY